MSTLEYTLRCCREIPYIKGQQRIYSVVSDTRGRILGESANKYTRSHPKQKHYSLKAGLNGGRCYLHSELSSIIQAAKHNPKKCKITIARVGANGRALDGKPCVSCRLAIVECGFITEISYSVEEK